MRNGDFKTSLSNSNRRGKTYHVFKSLRLGLQSKIEDLKFIFSNEYIERKLTDTAIPTEELRAD